MIAGISIFIIILALACLIIYLAGKWMLFVKAGQPGWKAIIPIYSDYMLFKLVWSTNAFWIYLILSLVTGLTMTFSGSYAFDPSAGIVVTGNSNFILDILTFVASIGQLFFSVMVSLKTSLAYSKAVLHAIGLLILPVIFYPILGFGSTAVYRGPQA